MLPDRLRSSADPRAGAPPRSRLLSRSPSPPPPGPLPHPAAQPQLAGAGSAAQIRRGQLPRPAATLSAAAASVGAVPLPLAGPSRHLASLKPSPFIDLSAATHSTASAPANPLSSARWDVNNAGRPLVPLLPSPLVRIGHRLIQPRAAVPSPSTTPQPAHATSGARTREETSTEGSTTARSHEHGGTRDEVAAGPSGGAVESRGTHDGPGENAREGGGSSGDGGPGAGAKEDPCPPLPPASARKGEDSLQQRRSSAQAKQKPTATTTEEDRRAASGSSASAGAGGAGVPPTFNAFGPAYQRHRAAAAAASRNGNAQAGPSANLQGGSVSRRKVLFIRRLSGCRTFFRIAHGLTKEAALNNIDLEIQKCAAVATDVSHDVWNDDNPEIQVILLFGSATLPLSSARRSIPLDCPIARANSQDGLNDALRRSDCVIVNGAAGFSTNLDSLRDEFANIMRGSTKVVVTTARATGHICCSPQDILDMVRCYKDEAIDEQQVQPACRTWAEDLGVGNQGREDMGAAHRSLGRERYRMPVGARNNANRTIVRNPQPRATAERDGEVDTTHYHRCDRNGCLYSSRADALTTHQEAGGKKTSDKTKCYGVCRLGCRVRSGGAAGLRKHYEQYHSDQFILCTEPGCVVVFKNIKNKALRQMRMNKHAAGHADGSIRADGLGSGKTRSITMARSRACPVWNGRLTDDEGDDTLVGGVNASSGEDDDGEELGGSSSEDDLFGAKAGGSALDDKKGQTSRPRPRARRPAVPRWYSSSSDSDGEASTVNGAGASSASGSRFKRRKRDEEYESPSRESSGAALPPVAGASSSSSAPDAFTGTPSTGGGSEEGRGSGRARQPQQLEPEESELSSDEELLATLRSAVHGVAGRDGLRARNGGEGEEGCA